MTPTMLILILVSVLLSVAAQLFLKQGMSSESVSSALADGSLIDVLFSIATNLSVITGLTAYAASMGAWLFVLSKMDVSKAYPFVGLVFVFTLLFAYFFLNEPITALKLTGTALDFAGVVMISVS